MLIELLVNASNILVHVLYTHTITMDTPSRLKTIKLYINCLSYSLRNVGEEYWRSTIIKYSNKVSCYYLLFYL